MCQWVSGGFPGGSSVFLQIGVAEIALLALSCFAEDMRFRAPMFSEAEINTGFQLCSSIVTGSVGSTAFFITKVSLIPCWIFPKIGNDFTSLPLFPSREMWFHLQKQFSGVPFYMQFY